MNFLKYKYSFIFPALRNTLCELVQFFAESLFYFFERQFGLVFFWRSIFDFQNNMSEFCVECSTADEVSPENLDSDNDEQYIPPAERIVTPSDAASFEDDDDNIYIVGTRGCKVTKIAGLENMRKLKVGWCMINENNSIVIFVFTRSLYYVLVYCQVWLA